MTSTTCPKCSQSVEALAARVSIYGMYDCHMFHKIEGRTVDEVIQNWERHNAEEHPAQRPEGDVFDLGPSTLCAAIVLTKDDKELRRVGKSVTVPGRWRNDPDQYGRDLEAYRQALLDDPDIARLLKGKNVVERYEIETHLRVYDNRHGDHIIVRPDGDGLGAVQLTLVSESDPRTEDSFVIGPPEKAELVAKAILRLCEDMKEAKGE